MVLHGLFTLALLGLIGWGVWQACRPRSVFVVEVEDGIPRVIRGRVTRAFLSSIHEACRHHDVTRGSIRGRAHGDQVALDFRGAFPDACRQQLRNVWVISGWSSGPRGKRPG